MQFKREADRLGLAIANLPPASGVDRSERGDSKLAKREIDGIQIPYATWTRITGVALDLGVAPPN